MRGFEPRSRHHDSGACSPLHHTGKNSCCHTPETVPYSGSLNQSQHNAVFVVAPQREVATYILQPVDWLARPASVPLKGEVKHLLNSGIARLSADGRPRRPVKASTRWLAWSSHLSPYPFPRGGTISYKSRI